MPDTTPAAGSRNYLDPATLAALVRDHRRTGAVSDDLGRALMTIAGGVWDRYHHTPDKDEFVQEGAMHLLGGPLRNCDPHKNLFSYFTTCLIRHGQKLRVKADTERRRFAEYAADRARAGDVLPGGEGYERWVYTTDTTDDDRPLRKGTRRTR